MKKKSMALLLTMALTVTTLMGCGGGSPSGSAGNSGESAPAVADTQEAEGSAGNEAVAEDTGDYEPVTIEFWNSWTGADGDILVELINRFNEENKWNITVEMDISAQFTEKFITAAPAGEAADIVLFSANDKWRYREYIQTITDIWDNTDLKEEDFVAKNLNMGKIENDLFAIPFQNSVYYLYWNKDLFEKAGLDPETPPSTYEEWGEMATKITDPENNIFGGGVCVESAPQIEAVIHHFGGMAITEESEGKFKANFVGNEGYEKFFRWEKTYLDSGDFPTEIDLASMFKAGQLGILVDGTWLLAGCDDAGLNFGVAQMPYGDAGELQVGGLASFFITTSASAEEKLACERFIQWWCMGNDADTDVTTTGDYNWSTRVGYPSSYQPTIDSEGYQSNERLQTMTIKDENLLQTAYAPDTFYAPGEFTNIISSMQQAVVYGTDLEKDMEQALQTAQEEAEKVIIEYHGEDALVK